MNDAVRELRSAYLASQDASDWKRFRAAFFEVCPVKDMLDAYRRWRAGGGILGPEDPDSCWQTSYLEGLAAYYEHQKAEDPAGFKDAVLDFDASNPPQVALDEREVWRLLDDVTERAIAFTYLGETIFAVSHWHVEANATEEPEEQFDYQVEDTVLFTAAGDPLTTFPTYERDYLCYTTEGHRFEDAHGRESPDPDCVHCRELSRYTVRCLEYAMEKGNPPGHSLVISGRPPMKAERFLRYLLPDAREAVVPKLQEAVRSGTVLLDPEGFLD